MREIFICVTSHQCIVLFQKAIKSKDYRNPYDINKQYPLDGDSYYVPPTTNTNENNNGIPKSGWDRMY